MAFKEYKRASLGTSVHNVSFILDSYCLQCWTIHYHHIHYRFTHIFMHMYRDV